MGAMEKKRREEEHSKRDVSIMTWRQPCIPHLAPRGEMTRHVIHRRTVTTKTICICLLLPSLLFGSLFMLLSANSPPPVLSDLTRALPPREPGKSFWQTADSVEEQGIAKRGTEENRVKRREREGGIALFHFSCRVPTSLFLTCRIVNMLFGILGLLFVHFEIPPHSYVPSVSPYHLLPGRDPTIIGYRHTHAL